MVTTKLNLSMTEPQVRQIYAKQGDTGRVLDITLDQTPEDGTLRILRPDGVEVTSEAVTGGEVESGSTFESLTEADVTELTVGIEPVQDLNGYDKPWVGGAGKNKLGVNWREALTSNGITFTPVFDNNGSLLYITGTGTSTGRAQYINNVAVFPSAGTYTLSQTTPVSNSCTSFLGYTEEGTSKYLDIGDTTGNTQRTGTIGTVSVMTYVVEVRNAGVTINDFRWYPQLELGTTATSYAPYSNICPITGHDEVTVTRTGKNLLNLNVRSATWNGITFTVYADGSIKVNGTATGSISLNGTTGAPPKISAGTTVTLSGVEGFTISQMYLQLIYTGADGSTISIVNTSAPTTYTFAQDATFASFWLAVRPNATINNAMVYPQLELGSTATSYEPYQGSTYTTSLGQTVYGGTLDMVSGVLTVDRAMRTFSGDSSDGWLAYSAFNGYYTLIGDMAVGTRQDGVSNMLVDSKSSVQGQVGAMWLGVNNRYIYAIGVMDVMGSTVSDFNQYLANNPLQVVYPLATPVEYQLTPQQIKTLVGTNNVWASSGDIVSIKFAYGGLLSELPSDATSIVGKCYCDVEQNGVSSMPFTLNVKKNERES